MTQRALQDLPNNVWTFCFGCGPTNEHGLQIKSHWTGEEAICTWQPQPHHAATPGILNGGVIASVIDCHAIWTAYAAWCQAEGLDIDQTASIHYVTGSLHVDYLRPTPMNGPITVRAQVREMRGRKSIVACSLYAGEVETARGEVVAVQVASEWQRQG